MDAATLTATRGALAAFGLAGATCHAVPSFSHHVLFVASSGPDAYLKRYPFSMQERVEATVRLVRQVAASAIPVPDFYRTRDGQIGARVGDYLFTLSSSIGRDTLLHSPDSGTGYVSSFLARLHRALTDSATAEPGLDHCPAMWDSFDLDARLQRLADEFRHASDPRGIEFRAFVDEIACVLPRVASLHQIDTPRGLLHGDFWPGNIVRTGTSPDALGTVDFDDAFHGPLLLDVAQFADLANARMAGGVKVGIDLGAATGFARRYAAEAGLSSDVLATLPEVLVAARISSALWIMQRHVASGPTPLDPLADNDMRTIRFVLDRMPRWQNDLARQVTVV